MRNWFDIRVWPGLFFLLSVAILLSFFSQTRLLSGFFLFLSCCHMVFFRNFGRKNRPAKGILSPADGHISEISHCFEKEYLNQDSTKIGIFLSMLDRHVNRIPDDGKVEYVKFRPGKWQNALLKKSAEKNQANALGIDCRNGKILVRQIVGAVARRIFCDVKAGELVARGDEFGVICYGSRSECVVPSHLFEPAVKIGQKVKAGVTILGYWKNETTV